MIGLMHHPLKYQVSPVGPSGEPGVLLIEGDRSRSRASEVIPLVAAKPDGTGYIANDGYGRTRSIGLNSPWHIMHFLAESPEEKLRDIASYDREVAGYMNISRNWTQQTLQRDIAALERFNAKVERNNQAVGATLATITGEWFGNPDAWLTWWNDKLGLRYERTEPTYKPMTEQYVPTVIPIRVHHSCFAAGTPVPTLTGPRPIESLKVGDVVLSQDTVTGALDYQPIVGVHHNPPAETLRIRLKDEALVSTPVHRFWRPGRGWAMAHDLKPGDFIRTVGGRAEVVEIRTDSVQPVFDLDVARNNSYFVGAEGTGARQQPAARDAHPVRRRAVPGRHRPGTAGPLRRAVSFGGEFRTMCVFARSLAVSRRIRGRSRAIVPGPSSCRRSPDRCPRI